MDMSAFIIAKSDQLNSDDLMAGPRTVTITGVRGAEGDQPVAVHYDGDGGKPFKPCKSMRRVMVACWGKDASKYAGRSMTLYRDPEVAFGGMKVGGIRISHMSDIDGKKQLALTATRGKKAPFVVLPLTDAPKPRDPPGSIVTAEEFRRRLGEAAEQGTKALETAWRDRSMEPLREHITDLESLKATARAADSFNQPEQPPADASPATGDYDGV